MRKAICFGVSKQKYPDKLEPIPHCYNDVEGISIFLSQKYCDFELEKVHNPTISTLKENLWNYFKDSGPNDEALIYFSGHGKRNSKRKLQLCTYETDPSRLVISSISFDEILQIISELELKSVLVILDCCFSGAVDKSMIIKGEKDAIIQYEDKITASKGLSVLCSTSNFQVSYAEKGHKLSSFSNEFILAAEKEANNTNKWIPVSRIFELLKYSQISVPKLIGENPNFRLLKGKKSIEPESNNNRIEREIIQQEQINHKDPLFFGMLVLPNFRAWLILTTNERIPRSSKRVRKNIYVLINKNEVYGNKVKDAEIYIGKEINLLMSLQKRLSSTIILLYPVSIHENTFQRFQRTDKKYILKNFAPLKARHYPVINTNQIHVLSVQDKEYCIHKSPNDYLSDSFGVLIDKKSGELGETILVKENSFSRNSKYLGIKLYSNLLIDYTSIGIEEEIEISNKNTLKTLFIEEVKDDRERIKSPLTFLDKKVNTKVQEKRKKSGYEPNCEFCMDEKYVMYSFNTREYRVPCKVCNKNENNSWKAFENLE